MEGGTVHIVRQVAQMFYNTKHEFLILKVLQLEQHPAVVEWKDLARQFEKFDDEVQQNIDKFGKDMQRHR